MISASLDLGTSEATEIVGEPGFPKLETTVRLVAHLYGTRIRSRINFGKPGSARKVRCVKLPKEFKNIKHARASVDGYCTVL